MTSARLLIVEDDVDISNMLRIFFSSKGYEIDLAPTGKDALEKTRQVMPHLIVLDIMLPDIDGYEVCRTLRTNARTSHIPVIFLTQKDERSDRLQGLELGVDDYITKPFDPDDLVAVVRGRLRRAEQLRASAYRLGARNAPNGSVLTVGALEINLDRHSVEIAGEPVDLSAREFTLLATLAKREGSVVSPEELVRVTHELHTDSRDAGSLVRPMIRSLRRKLGYPAGDMGCINNVRGVGYQLIACDG